jgi:hypothetical protein
MVSRIQISAAASIAILATYFAAAPCHAADRNRSFDSGQPRELINQPVCWSAEQPDNSGYCDFAEKT